MSVSTEVVSPVFTGTPVKGMKFKHAKRTNYRGEPLVLTVTSLQKTAKGVLVYSKTEYGDRVKTPLATFGDWVSEVVSVPGPPADGGVKLTAAQYQALHVKAHEAGLEAGMAHRPTPMVVQQHEHPLDDGSKVVQEWVVGGGVCGFAWVWTKGDSHFGRWARRHGGWTSSYPSGIQWRARGFGQSMEKKEAYCDAYVAVLREAGVTAYSQSRMD